MTSRRRRWVLEVSHGTHVEWKLSFGLVSDPTETGLGPGAQCPDAPPSRDPEYQWVQPACCSPACGNLAPNGGNATHRAQHHRCCRFDDEPKDPQRGKSSYRPGDLDYSALHLLPPSQRPNVPPPSEQPESSRPTQSPKPSPLSSTYSAHPCHDARHHAAS
jgi:hypothetical protein